MLAFLRSKEKELASVKIFANHGLDKDSLICESTLLVQNGFDICISMYYVLWCSQLMLVKIFFLLNSNLSIKASFTLNHDFPTKGKGHFQYFTKAYTDYKRFAERNSDEVTDSKLKMK